MLCMLYNSFFLCLPYVVQLHALVEYDTVEAAEKAVSVNLASFFYAIMVCMLIVVHL